MTHQHRGKTELAGDVVALRKQVADLKEEATARRRVEDALRGTAEELRAHLDGVPVPLARLAANGDPLLVNPALARRLGYAAAREVLGLGAVLGLFVDRTERERVLCRLRAVEGETEVETVLRRKDGAPMAARLLGRRTADAAHGEWFDVAVVG